MNNEQTQAISKRLDEGMEFYQNELRNVRTGRANPSLVEDLEVEYYGAQTPLKQAASITAQDARSIVIAPWDKDSLVNIEKAVNESDLGVNPVNDGSTIRITFPPLTEERREELIKVVRKKTEEVRINIRKAREDVWDEIQNQEKSGEISEDDKFRGKDKLQEIVDGYNKKVEEIAAKKEEEIRQV